MSQQKLYTEEQFKNAMHETFMEAYSINDLKEIYDFYKPIELPTDEEIGKESHNYFIRGQLGFEAAADTERAFLRGALWMRDKILNK